MTPADAGADPGRPELGTFPETDDPVGENSVTWLLNDLLAVDSGEDLFPEGIDLAPEEREIARAVNEVELPDDVLKMAKLVPPPRPPRRSARSLFRARLHRSAAKVRDIENEVWSRPDEPILVATDEARSVWRRQRYSWRGRMAALAVLMLVCALVAVLSWRTPGKATSERGQTASQHLSSSSIAPASPSTALTLPTASTSSGRAKSPSGSGGRPRRPANHRTRAAAGHNKKPGVNGSSGTGDGRPPLPVTTGVSLMTAAVAERAFDSTWPAFAQAANEGSVPGLAAVATPGAAKVAEAAHYCACAHWPVNAATVRLTSPQELSYPLSFAAEIDVTTVQYPFAVLAIFEKPGRSIPWEVGWVVRDPGRSPTLPPRSSFAATRPVIASGSLTSPIVELASLFQALRTSGTPPAGNFWRGDLETPGQLARAARQLVAEHAGSVAVHHGDTVAFHATQISPVFGSRSGYFACGEINSVTVETPQKGGVLVQPADRSAYGPSLAAGNYLAVTSDSADDFCVDVSLSGLVSAAGLTGGLYGAMGVPATSSQH